MSDYITTGRKSKFEDNKLNEELDRIWDSLSSARLFPRWRLYASNNKELHVQIYDSASKSYKSRVKIDKDGNISMEGTFYTGKDLVDVGRV